MKVKVKENEGINIHNSWLVGSAIISLFGGWDTEMATLSIFVAIDYISGLIVAGVFENSKKTERGALQSHVGWKGMLLLIVLLAYGLGLMMGTNYIRGALIIGFIINKAIRIMEDAELMDVKLPKRIARATDILNAKAKESEGKG